MLELAQKYAKLLKTSILAHAERDGRIIFVLKSGPKLSMTKAELEAGIESLSTPQADDAADAPPKPKAKPKGAKAK